MLFKIEAIEKKWKMARTFKRIERAKNDGQKQRKQQAWRSLKHLQHIPQKSVLACKGK